MKISYIITIQLIVCLLSFKWKIQGQINDKKQPVKLPINPIKMVKWGTTTANKIVTTTTPTRNPSSKVIHPKYYGYWLMPNPCSQFHAGIRSDIRFDMSLEPTTVFPHIVAVATILFWIHKSLKFHIVPHICNENLNSFLTRWGNYSRRGNYSREETIWGNMVPRIAW